MRLLHNIDVGSALHIADFYSEPWHVENVDGSGRKKIYFIKNYDHV